MGILQPLFHLKKDQQLAFGGLLCKGKVLTG